MRNDLHRFSVPHWIKIVSFLAILLIIIAIILIPLVMQRRQVNERDIATESRAPSSTAVTTVGSPTAVATFNSLGVYWSPPDGSPSNQCSVKYRALGSTQWKDALPLWYDSRNIGGRKHEYRGSIVYLTPGTTYEIQLTLASGTTATFTASTWSESFPVAKTVIVPSGNTTYQVTQGGTPKGYILYTAAPGGTTIDVNNNARNDITISAPYVIIRGLTLKGGAINGIELLHGAHDVVIENNDISGWGKILSDGFGEEHDSAIFAKNDTSIQRIIIQRNKMHDPRSNSNDWCESRSIYHEGPHPDGPQAVTFEYIGGNHVIRYNEIYGSLNHSFNDGMGGYPQDGFTGFPNSDTDIYGNVLMNIMDDAIETEGSVQNVRVWGNYIDQTYVGIATAVTAVGPLYVFRNIMNRSNMCPRQVGGYTNDGEHGPFGKEGDDGAPQLNGARIYFFHNTLLQPGGALYGPSSYGGPVINLVSRNNIWHTSGDSCYDLGYGSNNDDLDYDLCSQGAQGAHGINGTPIYAARNADNDGPEGDYQLAPNSPGFDEGQVLPNFNDGYTGTAPDIGAQEAGKPRMEFGVSAYLGTSSFFGSASISKQ